MATKKEVLNIVNFYIKEWTKCKYDNYKEFVADLNKIKCAVEELEDEVKKKKVVSDFERIGNNFEKSLDSTMKGFKL